MNEHSNTDQDSYTRIVVYVITCLVLQAICGYIDLYSLPRKLCSTAFPTSRYVTIGILAWLCFLVSITLSCRPIIRGLKSEGYAKKAGLIIGGALLLVSLVVAVFTFGHILYRAGSAGSCFRF